MMAPYHFTNGGTGEKFTFEIAHEKEPERFMSIGYDHFLAAYVEPIEAKYGTLDWNAGNQEYAGHTSSEVERKQIPNLLAEFAEAFRQLGFQVGTTYKTKNKEYPLPQIRSYCFDN